MLKEDIWWQGITWRRAQDCLDKQLLWVGTERMKRNYCQDVKKVESIIFGTLYVSKGKQRWMAMSEHNHWSHKNEWTERARMNLWTLSRKLLMLEPHSSVYCHGMIISFRLCLEDCLLPNTGFRVLLLKVLNYIKGTWCRDKNTRKLLYK